MDISGDVFGIPRVVARRTIEMSNAVTHQLTAALVMGLASMCDEADKGKATAKPLFAAALAAKLTKLPDILEPAFHPNHRQFFHGVAFASLVGLAGYRLYQWQPQGEWEEFVRFVLLVGAGSYLVHLMLDATTSKSLPLIGKL